MARDESAAPPVGVVAATHGARPGARPPGPPGNAARRHGAPGPRVRILGIDPGTRVVGWGVVDVAGSRHHLVAAGAIAPPADAPIEHRLAVISRAITALVVEHGPSEVSIEDVFFAKSAKAAIRLGEGRGAAIAAVTPLPVFAYAANEVKKAVTGRGGTSKATVARMVALLLGLESPPQPHDATDGLALALCHANRRRTRDLASK